MRNVRRAGRGSILNTLLVSLISCCVLTVLAVLLFSYLRTGEWFTERQGRKLEQYLGKADTMFTAYIDSYETVIRDLSNAGPLRAALREGSLPTSATLQAEIVAHKEDWSVDPLIHIVSPDGAQAEEPGQIPGADGAERREDAQQAGRRTKPTGTGSLRPSTP